MWVRLDDAIGDDPRIAEVGAIGTGMLVLALAYSNRALSDGWVPRSIVLRFIDRSTTEAQGEAIAPLLRCGLFTQVARDGLEGYQIHADFAALQPTREQVLKARGERHSQKAEAGRLGGLASGKARRKQARSKPEADTKQRASISEAPVPDPGPSRKDKSTAVPAVRLRQPEIATHGQLCRVYSEVLNTSGPDACSSDLKAAFKDALARHGLQAEQPDDVRKAMDAVEAARRVGVGAGRTNGFRQIATA